MDVVKEQVTRYRDQDFFYFPNILLKEKLTEKAFIRRSCFPKFLYDDKEREENSEQVEYRPAKQLPNGTIYLGQWLVGTQTRHGRGASIYSKGGLYEGYYANGRRDGKGRMVTEHGVVHEGLYENEVWQG